MRLCTSFIFLALLILASCTKPPDYSDVPEIEFVSMTKNTMIQGNTLSDSLKIVISFTDGDGDLAGGEGGPNIEMIDSRTGNLAVVFKVPEIPNSDNRYGISGTMTLTVFNDCCLPPNLAELCMPSLDFPTDTLTYSITLEDRAGNVSNAIESDPIVLFCN